MRHISGTSLAKIQTKLGTEPVVVLRIKWSPQGNYLYYADKTYLPEGIQGKILELGGLENVVNVTNSGRTQSLSVTLSDIDGTLKQIIDKNDIHKVNVDVYQWFTGIPFSEAFIIYQGEINSPIVWKEGDRTLSFDIVEKVEDVDVGFSAEEGQFDFVPNELIGKAWPLGFGIVFNAPALQIEKPPEGVLLNAIGVSDPNIAPQISRNGKKKKDLEDFAYAMILAALEAALTSFNFEIHGDPDEAKKWEDIQHAYEDAAAAALSEASQVGQDSGHLEAAAAEQGALDPTAQAFGIGAASATFPSSGIIQIGSIWMAYRYAQPFIHEGFISSFQAIATHILSRDELQFYTHVDANTTLVAGKFELEQPGTNVKLVSTYPINYIVNIIPSQVVAVKAYRKVGSGRMLLAVPGPLGQPPPTRFLPGEGFAPFPVPNPPSYYSIGQQNYGPLLNVTFLNFPRALSTYDDGWEDDIYVTYISTVGPNAVDIIRWFIQSYTTHGIDETSFGYVRTKVDPYPSNFVLNERKNILQVLQEISYQARCALWLDSGIFKIKFLPEEETTVDTITEADIDYNSLEVGHSETEKIVTKYLATWVTDYSQKEKAKVMLKHNVPKYGLLEKDYDFYAYNLGAYVAKAATFWLVRESNTWKILKFKTSLNKLNLETFDPILLDFTHPFVAEGPVYGIVNSAQYDSASNTIQFEVWVPVRLGEMTKYPFALPENIPLVFVYPPPDAILGFEIDTTFQDVTGSLPGGSPISSFKVDHTSFDNRSLLAARTVGVARLQGGDSFSAGDVSSYLLSTSAGSIDTGLQYTPTYAPYFKNYPDPAGPKLPADDSVGSSMPGQILAGSGTQYQVTSYPQGKGKAGKQVSAECLELANDTIPPGTWVILTKNGNKYYFQIGIWY